MSIPPFVTAEKVDLDHCHPRCHRCPPLPADLHNQGWSDYRGGKLMKKLVGLLGVSGVEFLLINCEYGLTMLGIVIGVTAVIILLAVGKGTRSRLFQEFPAWAPIPFYQPGIYTNIRWCARLFGSAKHTDAGRRKRDRPQICYSRRLPPQSPLPVQGHRPVTRTCVPP